MNAPLRLLQLSDVHFGTHRGGRLTLTEAAQQLRDSERRDAFHRAIAMVYTRELDGVVIPGDLFDDESVTTDLLRFVLHQFASIAPRPVFIAPGNHDPYGGTSPYLARADGAGRGVEWPDNVVVFDHDAFKTVKWPGRDDVSVTGCGVSANVPSHDRRLRSLLPASGAEIPLLLFHGSRDDEHWLQTRKATYPFSREELLQQPFLWTALGHYHDHQVIEDDAGRPVAAYAGCLFAGGLDEMGPKGCLIVEIAPERTPNPVQLEFVPIDDRQVRRVTCDLTGSEFAEDAQERVEAAIVAAGATAHDLVLLSLTGRRAVGLDLSFLARVSEQYFHLQPETKDLAPDIDFHDYPDYDDAITTEQRFVARLRPALDEDRTGTVRRALLYGLDALGQGRLDTRYED